MLQSSPGRRACYPSPGYEVQDRRNLLVEIAHDLRTLGHDALTVTDQQMAGSRDSALMARVQQESRVFMTMDKGIVDIQTYPPTRFPVNETGIRVR